VRTRMAAPFISTAWRAIKAKSRKARAQPIVQWDRGGRPAVDVRIIRVRYNAHACTPYITQRVRHRAARITPTCCSCTGPPRRMQTCSRQHSCVRSTQPMPSPPRVTDSGTGNGLQEQSTPPASPIWRAPPNLRRSTRAKKSTRPAHPTDVTVHEGGRGTCTGYTVEVS